VILPLVIAIAFFLIADIDSPRAAYPCKATESPGSRPIAARAVKAADQNERHRHGCKLFLDAITDVSAQAAVKS